MGSLLLGMLAGYCSIVWKIDAGYTLPVFAVFYALVVANYSRKNTALLFNLLSFLGSIMVLILGKYIHFMYEVEQVRLMGYSEAENIKLYITKYWQAYFPNFLIDYANWSRFTDFMMLALVAAVLYFFPRIESSLLNKPSEEKEGDVVIDKKIGRTKRKSPWSF